MLLYVLVVDISNELNSLSAVPVILISFVCLSLVVI